MVLIGNSQNDSFVSSSSISSIVVSSCSNEATRQSIMPQMNEKQKRYRPKDNQNEDTARIRRRRVEINAMKLETKNIRYSKNLPAGHPEKKTDVAIVRSINEIHSSNISVKTTSMMVRQGRVGVSLVPKASSAHRYGMCGRVHSYRIST